MGERLGAVVQAVGFVAAFALSGALAGVVWERVWDAPAGVAYENQWFLEPAGPDYSFSGTGWYVPVALVAGALTAFALGWCWPRHELVSLAAFVVGSMLAGWVMFKVGHALGPDDPRLLAAGQPDLTAIPSDLTPAGVDGEPRPFRLDSSALAAYPIGAMFASLYVYLVAAGRRSGRRSTAVGTPTAG
ncbi:hypothetical protein [Nocardioides sp. B-3]|uniref:hypothetical protein n=1 Tax=Nocardioides sp. B-3 TaxID=2895565 RepID=UPI0021535CEB|nr:hypothetical protein [Nocardioides sp. B-3]UUZ59634.1 hypothetical protein LP418_00225 [Nocardioides sp. B-3]